MTYAKNPKIIQESPEVYDPFVLGDYRRFVDEIPEVFLPDVKDLPSFCVVRNPIDRFVSAYCDRCVRYKNGEHQRFPTINDLFDNLEEAKKYETFFHHLKPMTIFYGTDLSRYFKIFSFSRLNELKKFLEGHYQIELPDLRLQSCEKIEKPLLTEDQKSRLMELYKDDFDTFSDYF